MSGVVFGKLLFSYSSWKEDSNDMLKRIFHLSSTQVKVREEITFFLPVFVTNTISRCLKPTTTLMNFAWINFFNTCAALASYRVNRFGCGFFLWFTFFTEHISNNVFKVIRHTLCGELAMKFIIIWLSIIIVFHRIFSRFFQRSSMRGSSLSLCMILMTTFNNFGYIFSWKKW